MHAEREQHTHLIDRAVDLYIFRVIDERFYNVFEKCLIAFHNSHATS